MNPYWIIGGIGVIGIVIVGAVIWGFGSAGNRYVEAGEEEEDKKSDSQKPTHVPTRIP